MRLNLPFDASMSLYQTLHRICVGKENTLPGLLVFAGTCFVFGIYAPIGFDGHHDGVMLKPAFDVARGQTLFKETFTQYGPFTTMTQALALKCFGFELLTLKKLNVFAYATAGTLFFLTLLRFVPLILGLLAWFIWLSMAPFLTESTMFIWSSVFALGFQSGALYAFVKYTENQARLGWLTFSGFCAAMIFWSRQPVGVLTLTGFAFILIVGHLKMPTIFSGKAIGRFLLGVLLGGGWLLIFLMVTDSYNQWYLQNIDWPRAWLDGLLQGASRTDLAIAIFLELPPMTGMTRTLYLGGILGLLWALQRYTPSFPYKRLALTSVLAGLATLYQVYEPITKFSTFEKPLPMLIAGYSFVAIIAIFATRRKINETHYGFVAFAVLAVASWAQYFPLADGRHIYWGIMPAIFCFTGLCYFAANRDLPLTLTLLTLLFARPAFNTWDSSFQFLERDRISVDEPKVLGGIKLLSPGETKLIPALAFGERLIERYQDTPILTYNEDAIFGTLAKNPIKPDPYYVYWGWILYSEFFRYNIRTREPFIRKYRPIIVMHISLHDEISTTLSEFGYTRSLSFIPANVVYLLPDEIAAVVGPVENAILDKFADVVEKNHIYK